MRQRKEFHEPWESGFRLQSHEGDSQLASNKGREGVLGKEGHLGGKEVKVVSCGWELQPSHDGQEGPAGSSGEASSGLGALVSPLATRLLPEAMEGFYTGE